MDVYEAWVAVFIIVSVLIGIIYNNYSDEDLY